MFARLLHLQQRQGLSGLRGISGSVDIGEQQGEVHSNDRDFGRFEGLRWVNPLR